MTDLSTGVGAVASQTTATAPPAESPANETAGIIAPGPWIAFGAVGVGFGLEQLHKFYVISQIPSALRDIIALLLMVYGGSLVWRANAVFHRAGTAFQPWRPTRVIAAAGVYSRTRNPMYQGFMLMALGLAVLFRLDWSALLLVPAGLLIHCGVVMREERYLARRFGDTYRAYLDRVPRYGWPLFGFTSPRHCEPKAKQSRAAR